MGMDEQEQERTQQAIAARLREEWAESVVRRELARPPRRRWPLRGRKTVGLIILVVVALILVPIVIVGGRLADEINALGTVKSFCDAESIGNFHAAYDQLSQRVRNDVSQDQMSMALQGANIVACFSNVSLTRGYGLSTNASGDQRQIDMTYNMTDGSIIGGTMTLHRDSDGWRVDSLQADDTFSLF